jgi:DNA sulfur modification protein DndC
MSRQQRSSEAKSKSAFAELGLKESVRILGEEIRAIYLADAAPWVVGYSGGKDSTATLQLVWMALKELPPEQLSKPIHVISTDTLVENPIVAAWVTKSLDTMQQAADGQSLPVKAHRLTPEVGDTFWVNLIGRGYPAPRHKFRWCTERMKIKPSNAFITRTVREGGEAILVLGTRKAESAKRSHGMTELEKKRIRDKLSPNDSLPGSLVYSPVENWSNDDVWMYLMQVKNPWGYDNRDLLTMYQGASPDGECPLVVDSSTPSCGDSRFGCWVCTLVEKDKSMAAMIQNDEEKSWMLPLLELRNALDVKNDRPLRDFRRMSGAVQIMPNFTDRVIPGPYKQASREEWLRQLLKAQRWIRENGPEYVRGLELVTLAELEEIRRTWVVDKHELEDVLPRVYLETIGVPYPGRPIDDHGAFGPLELQALRQVCGADDLHYQMTRDLLDISQRFKTKARRSGLYEELETAIVRSFYVDEKDAVDRASREKLARASARPREVDQCKDPEEEPGGQLGLQLDVTTAPVANETIEGDEPAPDEGARP